MSQSKTNQTRAFIKLSNYKTFLNKYSTNTLILNYIPFYNITNDNIVLFCY